MWVYLMKNFTEDEKQPRQRQVKTPGPRARGPAPGTKQALGY